MAPGKNETRWVFLDRDGVLVGDRMHVYRIGDLKILPNVAEGLKKMQSLGFKFIVVTNQAGVARGLFTIHDAKQFNDVLLSRLERKGIHIEKVYLCPHHPDFTGACGCRKPKNRLSRRGRARFQDKPQGKYFRRRQGLGHRVREKLRRCYLPDHL